MATKIRLQRHGRKGYAFYRIVAADSRAPRDGRFIESIGTYNPNTNPATIDLKFDRALYWVSVGAQPTDTVRCILSQEGVLLRKHLNEGVKKNAFDQATADKRFEEWKAKKEQQLNSVRSNGEAKLREEKKQRLEAEKKVNEARAKELADKIEAERKAKEEMEAAKAAEEAAAISAELPAQEEAQEAAPAAEESAEAPAEA